MGTNYYWMEGKSTFLKEPYTDYADELSEDSIYIHIGKRGGCGLCCFDCGNTLCKEWDHRSNTGRSDWFEVCPVCGKEGTPSTSFTVTLYSHISRLRAKRITDEKVVVNEYGEEFSASEFLNKIYDRCHMKFQSPYEFC